MKSLKDKFNDTERLYTTRDMVKAYMAGVLETRPTPPQEISTMEYLQKVENDSFRWLNDYIDNGE